MGNGRTSALLVLRASYLSVLNGCSLQDGVLRYQFHFAVCDISVANREQFVSE